MDNHEGKILRARRIELGMTQQDIAIELNMSIRQYQRYEYGEHRFSNCPMRIGLRICAMLKLDPFDVVFENGIDNDC